MFIGGHEVVALVDMGCTTTMVQTHLIRDWKERSDARAFNGRKVKCWGKTNVMLELEGHQLSVEVLVVDQLMPGVKVNLRIGITCQLGGFHSE